MAGVKDVCGVMRMGKAGVFGVCILLLVSFGLVGLVGGVDDSMDLVDAEFVAFFETGDRLSVEVVLSVSKVTTDREYSAEEIRSADDVTKGEIQYALYLEVRDQLHALFPSAELLNFSTPKYSGDNPSGVPGVVAYDPPVVFTEVLEVELPAGFFGFNESVDVSQVINGILDMEGVVEYGFDMRASPGWNNTYVIELPEYFGRPFTNGEVSNNQVIWVSNNWDGQAEVTDAVIQLKETRPTFIQQGSENISLIFELDTVDIDRPGLTTHVLIESINNTGLLELPVVISNVDVIPADGIRLFADNELLKYSHLYDSVVASIADGVESAIEQSSYNQTLSLVFEWDTDTTVNCTTPYQIHQMDTVPAVGSTLVEDDFNLKLYDMSPTAFFGLIYAGAYTNITQAEINFGDALERIGLPYTVLWYLPEEVTIAGKTVVYTWNVSAGPSGAVNAESAPAYADKEIDTVIEISVDKFELNLPSFLTGNTELTASFDLQGTKNIYVDQVPAQMGLPAEISLAYLNADGFRVCIQEGVFSDDEVQEYLTAEKTSFESTTAGILAGLKVNGFVDRALFRNSLQWNEDVTSMDALSPVVIPVYARCLYSVPFGVSVFPPEFNISHPVFTLQGISDQEVLYRVIFPNGIDVVSAEGVFDNEIVMGETADGCDYLEVVFDDAEELSGFLTCQLAVSPVYVLGLFLPCILSVILVVILIVVLVIVRRKKRGGGFVSEPRPAAREQSYEEEEYYVPPPPRR